MRFDCFYSFKGEDTWLTFVTFSDQGKVIESSSYLLCENEKRPNKSASLERRD